MSLRAGSGSATPLRAGLYGRVSRDNTKSVDSQLDELAEAARRERWRVIGTWRDDGVSASRFAKQRTRPGWVEAMAAIEDGQLDVLAAWELSRATRDRAVWAALIAACIANKVHIYTSGRILDPSNASDAFTLDIDAASAFRASAEISERVNRSVRSRVAEGAVHNTIAYGYHREYDPHTRALLGQQPDVDTAPIVREIVRRALAGDALYSIAQDLNRRSVATPAAMRAARRGQPPPASRWNTTIVRRIAMNPVYAALRVHVKEVAGPGKWPALVSAEDHAAAVEMLGDASRRTYRDGATRHLLSGIMLCGVCGARCRLLMNQRSKRYQCFGRFCVAVQQTAVDKLVEQTLLRWLADPDKTSQLAGRGGDDSAAEAAREVADLRARLTEFCKSAAAGGISAGALAQIEAKLLPAIADAEARAVPANVPAPVAALMTAADVAAHWKKLLMPHRRQVVRTLLDVRLHPTRRGSRTFDPNRVKIRWRTAD